MTDRKKPNSAFWTFGGRVVLTVIYHLVLGPACWWRSRDILPDGIGTVYMPLLYASADRWECFYSHYYPRPGWKQIMWWGKLNDGGLWHRSNMSISWYQNTVTMRWRCRYSRELYHSGGDRHE